MKSSPHSRPSGQNISRDPDLSSRAAGAARPSLLVIEDDESMATALTDGLELEGYDVEVQRDGAAGLERALKGEFDLIVLDVMLPSLSGVDILKQVRSAGRQMPILMLTAKGQEIDKVLGLKLGADDYMTKPFGFMELTARIEALLRRLGRLGRGSATSDEYRFGSVRVVFNGQEVWNGDRRIELSPREFELLRYMIRHRGKVVRRDELLDAVWGYDDAPLTRTIDVHVAKLRRKIEADPQNPEFLLTVHRVGYRFMG